MAETKLEGDVYITGRLRMGSVVLPDNCVYDDQVPAGADIDPTKMVRNRISCLLHGFKTTTDAADGIYIVHVFKSAGKLIDFRALCATDPVGDDVVEFDLLACASGGALASVLDSGTEIAIVSTTGNNTAVAGTIAAGSVNRAAGDVLAIEVDAIHGTGTMGIGPFAEVIIEEEP
jgi:hypothetical protein